MSIRRAAFALIAYALAGSIAFMAAANEPPVADFTAYRVRDAAEAEILLDASASTDPDGEVVNYQWVFGDGTTGSGVSVVHTYDSYSKVNITLLAYDDGGSWHLITKTVDLSLTSLAPLGSEPQETESTDSGVPADASVAQTDAPVGHDVGNRAPGFSLPDPEGELVELSDFLGHVVLVEFWKSTCGGCQSHTPVLDAYSKSYTERGLVVILIVLDLHMTTAQRYLLDRGYDRFVLLHETLPYRSGTLLSYNVPGTPHAVLIDRSGEIQFIGYPALMTGALIESLL